MGPSQSYDRMWRPGSMNICRTCDLFELSPSQQGFSLLLPGARALGGACATSTLSAGTVAVRMHALRRSPHACSRLTHTPSQIRLVRALPLQVWRLTSMAVPRSLATATAAVMTRCAQPIRAHALAQTTLPHAPWFLPVDSCLLDRLCVCLSYAGRTQPPPRRHQSAVARVILRVSRSSTRSSAASSPASAASQPRGSPRCPLARWSSSCGCRRSCRLFRRARRQPRCVQPLAAALQPLAADGPRSRAAREGAAGAKLRSSARWPARALGASARLTHEY